MSGPVLHRQYVVGPASSAEYVGRHSRSASIQLCKGRYYRRTFCHTPGIQIYIIDVFRAICFICIFVSILFATWARAQGPAPGRCEV